MGTVLGIACSKLFDGPQVLNSAAFCCTSRLSIRVRQSDILMPGDDLSEYVFSTIQLYGCLSADDNYVLLTLMHFPMVMLSYHR